MKNSCTRISITLLVILCSLFSGCKEPGVGDFNLTVKDCGPDYVDLFLTAPGPIEFAYELSKSPLNAVNPSVLFATGTVISGGSGDVIKLTDGVVQDTKYYLYAVSKLNATEFTPVIKLEFTTAKYQFDETLTVIDTYYDGYKMHITVPESVKTANNALRYSMASLAVYNKVKNGYGSTETDMLLTNGGAYTRFVKNDSTMLINNENIYELDDNGEVVLDENGEPYDFHDPVSPGEPSVFLVGEFKWGDVKEYGFSFGGVDPDTGFDRDKGYFLPLFNWDTNEWQGTYAKKLFLSKEPSLLEAEVEIDIPENEISCIDAMIYIKPEEGVYQYLYAVVDAATYQAMLALLDEKEEYIQWFLTSYLALFELGCEANQGPIQLNAASQFTEPLEAGSKYYVLLTAMGDAEGTSQRFYKKEFTAKAKTKKAPVVVVTAHEQDKAKPYEASFNVKAPNGDLMGAYFACNYARDFELMLNADYTYESLVKGNYSFTPEEIQLINSKDGYDMVFNTLDGEVTRLAVYGFNDEYTFNSFKEDEDGNISAVADYKAPYAQRTPEVTSSLYDELAGTWTATATLSAKQVMEDGETVVSYNLQHSTDVVISRTAPEVPAKVENFVYDLYPKKAKDEVDAMLETLKAESEIFTENRLTNRNRLLCTGFLDFDYYQNPGRMDARTPYDLFKATDYSSIDEAQILNDFGPKWYLEVLDGDKVIVPFNDTLMPPMHVWPGSPFQVGAFSRESNYTFTKSNENIPGFPVEISSDKNTIKIKPIVINEEGKDVNYYMNAILFNDAYTPELIAPVISEIVLKRKAATQSASEVVRVPGLVAERVEPAARNHGGTELLAPRQQSCRSLTRLVAPVRYKIDEYPNVITEEALDKALDNYIEKRYNIKMK